MNIYVQTETGDYVAVSGNVVNSVIQLVEADLAEHAETGDMFDEEKSRGEWVVDYLQDTDMVANLEEELAAEPPPSWVNEDKLLAELTA